MEDYLEELLESETEGYKIKNNKFILEDNDEIGLLDMNFDFDEDIEWED